MTDESGNLSIDFLVGFTIFMLAFIWVASMVPGLLIGLKANSIDYDAVAYRTGVILVEDPGWPASPPWEAYPDGQKDEIIRFGLAVSKDSPNILSEDKINRFFCTSFIYPDDYHTRAIFGDYNYLFNISVLDVERNQTKSVGSVLPDGYGYIRRLTKIKGLSNTTIGKAQIEKHHYNNTENVTTHEFSVVINNTKLLGDIVDPAYQIDPARDTIIINITDLRSTIKKFDAIPLGDPGIDPETVTITLNSIKVYRWDSGTLSMVRTYDKPYIDGGSVPVNPSTSPTVEDNVSLIIDPRVFDIMKAGYSQVYINFTFGVNPECTFLNNTNNLQVTPQGPFSYDYFPENVTQPRLRDAVVEVAVW
jgi:hypothetical protein